METKVYSFEDLCNTSHANILRAKTLSALLDISCMTKNGNVIRIRLADEMSVLGLRDYLQLSGKAQELMEGIIAIFESRYRTLYANIEVSNFTFELDY